MAYNNRGLAYINKGQYDEAISDCTKAIEINPELAEAYSNRGGAYYFRKEYDNAWDDVEKAQDLGFQIDPVFLQDLQEVSRKNFIQTDTGKMRISVILVKTEPQAQAILKELNAGTDLLAWPGCILLGQVKKKAGISVTLLQAICWKDLILSL